MTRPLSMCAQERLKASLPTLEASRVQLEGDKAREEAAYDEVLMSLRGETDTLRVAMEVKQAELRPLAEAMAEVSAQLETARQEERLLRERLEAGGKEVSTMKASLAKVEAEAVAKVADMALAQKEVAALEAKQAELTAAVAAISAQEAEASASLRAAREKVRASQSADRHGRPGSSRAASQAAPWTRVAGAAHDRCRRVCVPVRSHARNRCSNRSPPTPPRSWRRAKPRLPVTTSSRMWSGSWRRQRARAAPSLAPASSAAWAAWAPSTASTTSPSPPHVAHCRGW